MKMLKSIEAEKSTERFAFFRVFFCCLFFKRIHLRNVFTVVVWFLKILKNVFTVKSDA